MRVLHILDHSIPLHSGYSFRTLALLREQRRLGWQTFHLTGSKQPRAGGGVEEIDGFEFYRCESAVGAVSVSGLRELAMMRALEQRLRTVAEIVRPDLLHAHSPVLNALPALRVGRALKIPVVYEVRAFWEDAAVDHGSTREGSPRYRLTRWLETWALRRAQHVFTICEGLRADIVGRGLSADKITVIPNAVDVESFAPGRTPDGDLKAQLGLRDALVIGFIGSFYAYEGLDLLLEAMPALLSSHPNVQVLLVGGGPQEDALKARARQLGLADQVVFTGRVPHTEVQRYYDLIDILAYPRRSMRLTELVTPLKPLEAMAQGRLFVASDVGGHRELIRDGETGVLFKAGDSSSLAAKLGMLLSQPAQWQPMQTAGRRFVEQERTWRASVANYQSPYQALLDGSRSAQAAAPT